jgi:hypothetical protein
MQRNTTLLLSAAVLSVSALAGCQQKDPNARSGHDAPIADGGAALDTRATTAGDRMGRYPSDSPSMRGTTAPAGNPAPGATGTPAGVTGTGTTTGAGATVGGGSGTGAGTTGATGTGTGTVTTPGAGAGVPAGTTTGAGAGASGNVDIGTREAAGTDASRAGAAGTGAADTTAPRTEGQGVNQGQTPTEDRTGRTPPAPPSQTSGQPAGGTTTGAGQGPR